MVSPIYNIVNFISRFISLSEIVLCDDLSYTERRYIVPSTECINISVEYVITLAPPLLPLPLDAMEILTFRTPLPKSVPMVGFSFNSRTNEARSLRNEA